MEPDIENPFEAWLCASAHAAASFREANRALFAAINPVGRRSVNDGSNHPSGTEELAYAQSDWSVERDIDSTGHITVGDTVRFEKHVSDADVRAFAAISGDTNRLHLDDEFASGTRFGERVAHGTLVSGLISAALARLPGLVVYLSQDLQFVGPVTVDQRLEAVVEVVEALGDERYRLATSVENEDGETVIEGDAVVLIDSLPDGDSVSGAGE